VACINTGSFCVIAQLLLDSQRSPNFEKGKGREIIKKIKERIRKGGIV